MKDATERRYVWDLPTRLLHWGIVVLIGFSWWSAETGRMEWHYRSGLTLCALVLFRLIWGFLGSSTARFSGFVKGPRAVWRHFRQETGEAQPSPPGHNPIGGWSVLALLGLLTLQIVTGLFAVDIDGVESGPLSHLLDFDRGRTAAQVHDASFNLLLALSAIHVTAILFYHVVRRRNLTWTMVSGYQHDGGGEGLVRAPWWRLVLAVAIALTVAFAVSTGFRF